MLTFNKILVATLGVLITAPLSASTEAPKKEESKVIRTMQFTDALASSYATNATLQENVALQKVEAERVPSAKAGWRPRINAETSVTRSVSKRESPLPRISTHRNTTTGSVSATQNVFNGGGTLAAVSSAENFVRAGWADFEATEQSTLLSAASSYLELYSTYEVLKLNQKNENVFKELLKSVRTRAQLGELTGTDVANAESQLADAITKRIQANADLETKKGTYLKVIGLEAPDQLTLPKMPEDLIPTNYSDTVNKAMIGNPSIRQRDYLARAFHDQVGVNQATLLPKVDISGAASRTNVQGSTIGGITSGRSNDYQAKATLSVPLFQGGSSWSGLRKARQESTQNKITLERTRRDVREAAKKAWENWVSIRDRIVQLKIQIKSARTNLDGVRSEFKEGERIFIEVLDAESKHFTALVSLETATKDHFVAGYTLLSLIGHMTAHHLKLPVEKYDVEGHYELVKNMWFGTTG